MSVEYESVIGLEVHAQLQTMTKMFSACPNEFGGEPNTRICPVSTGQPGSLPVINRTAIELGVRAAIALSGTVHNESVFARKHYFYPDLPKNYQISQYDKPYCTGAKLKIHLKSGEEKNIGITRIHFEEDAGRSIHTGSQSQVDLNRAGVPLIEIVSEPDIRTAEEAGQYLRTLRQLLRYIEVCDGDMEKGNFRCDANVSIRPYGQKELGTKVELKNINSFRFVEKAIHFEVNRQIQCTKQGEVITQQTRSWNAEKGTTDLMREKEQAHDYRYFPEPDLPVLSISESWQKEIAGSMPELPEDKRSRFCREYKLSEDDATILTSSRELAQYFEHVVSHTKDAKLSANWIVNDLLGRLNAVGMDIVDSPVSSRNLSSLISKVQSEAISGKIAKAVFDEMFDTKKTADVIIQEKGLAQISDAGILEPIVKKLINAHPEQVASYKAGKVKLFGFFVGQAMKETNGQANPGIINKLLKKHLDS